METLAMYSIPILGMGLGIHKYKFVLTKELLQKFEESPFKDANIIVEMSADKRFDVVTLHFEYVGTVACECDRCTANINMPIQEYFDLIVKLTEENEELNTEEIIIVHPKDARLTLDKILYDFLLLSVPMVQVYDCEDEKPQPCNQTILDYLDSQDEQEDEANDQGDSIWSELKKKLK